MSVLQGRWVQWVANGLAVIALLLAVYVVFLSNQNRGLQGVLTAQRTDLAKAQTFAQLDSSLVQLLAKTAAEKNDPALQGLLARNGITFQVQAPGAGNAGPAAPANAGGAR